MNAWKNLPPRLTSAGDPEVRAAALELVQSVVELHGAALQRLVDKCLETSEGERVISAALDDNLVSGMFLLHSLHPDSIETRVARGLESVRPYLKSHGGDCELVSVRDGIVRLKLHGSCGSCPSSSVTLKNAVEEALYEAAPDIVEIVAENATAEPSASTWSFLSRRLVMVHAPVRRDSARANTGQAGESLRRGRNRHKRRHAANRSIRVCRTCHPHEETNRPGRGLYVPHNLAGFWGDVGFHCDPYPLTIGAR